jgi:formylglycine-generating enzyme required for sulfatase activity
VTSFSAIDAEFSTSLTNVLIWTGVAKDDIYRTDKMVFRRIPAAGESFMMFTNNAAENVNGGAGVKVSFTNDFYIGVFEVTQAQVAHFYGSWSANETNALYAATRAASCAKLCGYNAALRSGSNANTVWPENLSHTVSQVNSCLMGNMQKKTKLLIDLPTEAMWEFACRAGTTTRLYTGHAAKVPKYNDSHTKKIMRVVDVNGQGSTSVPGRNCDLSVGPNKPGCYKPNAFGLYDMYGNLWEWCLDRYTPAKNLPGGVEPPGPAGADVSEPAKHVLRGGSYRWNATYVEDRLDRAYSYGTEDHGARLCIWLTGNPEGTL